MTVTDYHQIAAHARWELDRLADHNRADMDAFTQWAERQTARAKEELTELCDEMGAPYFWATVPSTVRQATLDNLVRNNRPPGWVPPPRPAVLAGPAPDDTMPGREATMPALTVAPEGTCTQPGAVDAGGAWWRRIVDTLVDWSRL